LDYVIKKLFMLKLAKPETDHSNGVTVISLRPRAYINTNADDHLYISALNNITQLPTSKINLYGLLYIFLSRIMSDFVTIESICSTELASTEQLTKYVKAVLYVAKHIGIRGLSSND
jgi:hypothetical protein